MESNHRSELRRIVYSPLYDGRIKLLVEYPGIEPGVPLGGGFTVHCITIDASTP